MSQNSSPVQPIRTTAWTECLGVREAVCGDRTIAKIEADGEIDHEHKA